MRILFLSTSMGMGGADQQILILAHAMRSKGHDVRIVSLAPLGAMGLEARELGLVTESLNIGRNVAAVAGVVRLRRMLRQWRPNIVHSHMVHANLLARISRLWAPIPVLVSTIHSIRDGGRGLVAASRLTNGLVDRFTIISRLAAEHFVRIGAVPADRMQVIPNAVDVERFHKRPEARTTLRQALGLHEEFVWLAVGRFEPAKDYPTMVAAFARVAARRPGVRLLLVGAGSLEDEVRALVHRAGLDDRVIFLGVRRDIPELMNAADGYVLSSAWEGMPVVLLEAAASELPVVATRVGGVAEVVRDGVTGWLAPAGAPDALADAMTMAEQLSAEELAAMGREGRVLVQREYGTNRIMEAWAQYYEAFTVAPASGRRAAAGHR